jgi:hypothetical protein
MVDVGNDAEIPDIIHRFVRVLFQQHALQGSQLLWGGDMTKKKSCGTNNNEKIACTCPTEKKQKERGRHHPANREHFLAQKAGELNRNNDTENGRPDCGCEPTGL